MYAVEAARRLKGRAEFRWVGAFKMNPTARQDLGDDVDFVGPVPRSEIFAQLDWADVYLLPSLVEGSATSTYEALTAARPVVCTPNCGSVVRDGVEGYIVPIRDVDAIVEKLERLAGDADLRTTMGEAAGRRAAEMDYNAYARGLIAALDA
jgi:glycosyltransferase involved in cell wall biosynthesis